ncbi:hypothetical protein QTO34_006553 [Cnephaeus nilssonii]|uniref:Reverse transcriptase/retrotransposon-derived protein RNase H-like domain-containing protein n=1 Tax=Cnephaeus nilssonii TaxID=3371016 RepID=A0AA40HLM6_CNENI|nr:hypothetical protein QTO34_006553 [Eptesicus nilssonii]
MAIYSSDSVTTCTRCGLIRPVGDAPPVAVLERRHHLPERGAGLPLAQRAVALQVLTQVPFPHVLHDQNAHTPCVDMTSYRNYLDMPSYPLRGTEREFLGAVGYYNLWIPGLRRLLNLYTQALVSAPALALPDITKPFHLHVSEVRGIAKGVLTQTLGPWKRPVAYLSKRLDPVAAGWPACLWAVDTTALLVKEADKLIWARN